MNVIYGAVNGSKSKRRDSDQLLQITIIITKIAEFPAPKYEQHQQFISTGAPLTPEPHFIIRFLLSPQHNFMTQHF
jgi:hypothetical protein